MHTNVHISLHFVKQHSGTHKKTTMVNINDCLLIFKKNNKIIDMKAENWVACWYLYFEQWLYTEDLMSMM